MDNETREGRTIRRIPQDTFGHRLLLARAEAGNLTLDVAATRCGLNPQNWSNWEKGKTPRDQVEVAEVVAEGLNIDRDWLLYGGPLAPRVRKGIVSMGYRSRPKRPTHPPTDSTRPGGRRPRRLDSESDRSAA